MTQQEREIFYIDVGKMSNKETAEVTLELMKKRVANGDRKVFYIDVGNLSINDAKIVLKLVKDDIIQGLRAPEDEITKLLDANANP